MYLWAFLLYIFFYILLIELKGNKGIREKDIENKDLKIPREIPRCWKYTFRNRGLFQMGVSH